METPSTSAMIDEAAGAVERGELSESALRHITRWLMEPDFEPYREQLVGHIEQGRWRELDDAFWTVIPFGTGGRRGRIYPIGTATINGRTIGESAQGLADYLHSVKQSGERHPMSQTVPEKPFAKAVVAYDTRHHSREFAELTAEVLAASGVKVYLFPAPRATPELSFAVRHLDCDAGVMISASHNPPSDNGFKCYWSTGGQVLPPHDQGIIDAVYRVGAIHRMSLDEGIAQGRIEYLDESLDAAYVDAVCAQSVSPARDIRALFTPLHGVGESSVYRVLRQAGFDRVEVAQSQRRPDGDFPNVPGHIANPEVPRALDPALEEARKGGFELLLASDPDADRLGAVVPDPDGEWVHLTGNQIAALLTDNVLRHLREAGVLTSHHYVVKTLVTTEMVRRVAEHYGAQVRGEHLVGFKYIAQEMDASGPEHFVFGAEESYGYLKGHYARDKDGAVAAMLLVELAAELKSQGRSLLDRLDELYVRHGYHEEQAASKTCEGSEGSQQIARLMERFRREPPLRLAGLDFQYAYDYQEHEVRELPENRAVRALQRPAGDLVIIHDAKGAFSFAARPSGTEPKIKFYFFAHSPVASLLKLSEVKRRTGQQLAALREALMQWVSQVVAER